MDKTINILILKALLTEVYFKHYLCDLLQDTT